MTSATYNTAVTKFWPNKECGLWIASEKLNSMNGLELFFLSSPTIDDWVWGPGKTQNWRVKKSNLLGSSDAVWLSKMWLWEKIWRMETWLLRIRMVDQEQPHSPRLKKSLWLITTKNSVTKTWEPWIQRYPLGLDFGTWHSVQSHKCCEHERCQRIQFQFPGARLGQEVHDQIHQRSAGHGKEKLVC